MHVCYSLLVVTHQNINLNGDILYVNQAESILFQKDLGIFFFVYDLDEVNVNHLQNYHILSYSVM